jgi:capsular polysaccharide biosynthesis protein
MDSQTLATLAIIGFGGYMIFKFWKTILKMLIGLLCFCVVYTYLSLKKYFDGTVEGKEKIEQVVQETVMKSTPNF